MLKVSAFYLEKQKSFIPKNNYTNGDSSLYDLYNIMTLTQSNLPWPTYLPNNEENRDTIFSFFSQNKYA